MGDAGIMRHLAAPSALVRLAREHGVDGKVTVLPLWQARSVLVVAPGKEGLERMVSGSKDACATLSFSNVAGCSPLCVTTADTPSIHFGGDSSRGCQSLLSCNDRAGRSKSRWLTLPKLHYGYCGITTSNSLDISDQDKPLTPTRRFSRGVKLSEHFATAREDALMQPQFAFKSLYKSGPPQT